ncbi:MAG: cytidylate kinase-like family protein [Deltaproteobacteria bacterium]|nr:cytidylate kinase-like family protein [Deltaproteobacteria bacterium]
MAVITISRQIGAGGWTLGQRLARRLGYRYVDERMIKEVADKIGVTPEHVQAFEKEGKSKLNKILDMVVSRNFIDRQYGFMDERRYVDVVRAIIRGLYEQGNVVIVGRGGQYILKGSPNLWRLLLVDDLTNRIRFITNSYKMTDAEAEDFIKNRDRIRTNFLSFFADKSSHDDPRSYDLALNMENIDMGKAERLVLDLIAS